MDLTSVSLISSPLFLSYMLGGVSLLFLVFNVWDIAYRKKAKLPPGPPGWPVVGNLFQIGNMPNESLFHLAKKYGPIITLHLGVKTTIVVSSPDMAKEVLKIHDQVLSGRTVIEAAKCASYGESSVVWNACGPRWRMLRRICNTELFSAKRLEALQHLRRDQVFRMVGLIYEDHLNGKSVSIGHTVFLTGVNLLGNMIFSQNMFGRDSEAGEEFKEAVAQLMELGGVANLADFFPWLRFLDPQGVSRGTTKYLKFIFGLFEKFIKERLASRQNGSYGSGGAHEKDLLDVLLDSRSDGGGDNVKFTEKEMTRFVYDMFVAGSETTSTTIEWAMAELIRNPHTLKRVQAELEEVVGRHRKVEESDTERLPYLHAVVKEVFRLHPSAPLLIQHRAESSCEIAGFVIPKGAEVLVNVWAIGRDPNIWKEPLTFDPERFWESEIEYRGQHFELLPFGSGRRICPGLPLANRMVHFVLASLLHSFDWTLPDGQPPEKMDMTPKYGISLLKALPLNAIPSPRLPATLY
eukprot:Gb_34291 [translate_table: standard]